MSSLLRILFLCVHNSARSILAEYLVNAVLADRVSARSAGLHASQVSPYAIRVLQEIGIDATAAYSKSIDVFRDDTFDLVVTVCGPSEGECPVWLKSGRRMHVPFEDPARVTGSDDAILEAFRSTREEIRSRLLPIIAAELGV